MAFIEGLSRPDAGNYLIADGIHDSRLTALRQLAESGRLRQVTVEIGFGYFGPDGVLRRFMFSEIRGAEEAKLVNFQRVTTTI